MSDVIAPSPNSDSRAPVSAVIPCYRCSRAIDRALDSVARQTYLPVEVIVVDDGSADDTLRFLLDSRRRAGTDWIKVIPLDENRGPGAARNTGWDIASGKYIAFLDADDAWHPRKLELQTAVMEANADLALCGHAHRRLKEGEQIDASPGEHGLVDVTFGMLLRSNRFITPSAMIRRDLPFRFPAGQRYMEDHLLWLELASRGLRVARMTDILAFTYKAPIGESGLSAHTWEMRKAEISNFWCMRKGGRIGIVSAIALSGYALVKHCFRLLTSTFHAQSG